VADAAPQRPATRAVAGLDRSVDPRQAGPRPPGVQLLALRF
jgi:hypothetical protein